MMPKGLGTKILNVKTVRGNLPLILLLLWVTTLTLPSCWYYSFKGTLPPHIKSIAIPNFEDNTAEFNIQQVVTEQIRMGFIQENILKVVNEENASSVLYGTILDVKDAPLVYTSSRETGESVEEYRITLQIEAEWYDKINAKAMFKKRFTGFSEYDPTGGSEESREKALTEAVDQITEDIINAILTGW